MSRAVDLSFSINAKRASLLFASARANLSTETDFSIIGRRIWNVVSLLICEYGVRMAELFHDGGCPFLPPCNTLWNRVVSERLCFLDFFNGKGVSS
jgi:hypothetical protein